jgi:DNA-binding CsgD family transcriptional regulator
MLFEELTAEAIRQTTLQGLRATIEKAAQDLGFEYLAHGRSLTRDTVGRPPNVEVLAITYPGDWYRRYSEKAYGSVDAVVQISAMTNAAFCWHSVPSFLPLSQAQQTIFAEARAVGLRNGVTVPIHHLNGKVEIVSFATTSSENLRPNIQTQMQAIGSLLALRQQELEKFEPVTPSITLSERERECLTWVAIGKSSWDIARILNISTNTVNFHVKNAIQKLGCNNRVFAVVLALRLGLIQP